MCKKLYPKNYVESTYVIDFEKCYEEGFRGVLFDIDNTLVPHGAPADDKAVELFKRLDAIGFKYCLISNNKGPRIIPFADAVGAKNYIVDAHKPMVKSCIWSKPCRNAHIPCKTNPSKGRDTDSA